MKQKISPNAIKCAKEILKNLPKIQEKGNKHTYWMAGGDPWGPSLSDIHDGVSLVIDEVAKIIQRNMK